MKKKGQVGPAILVGAVVVIAAILVMGAFGVSLKSLAKNGGDAAQPDIDCNSETSPSLDIQAYDAENVGSAVTEATNLYRKKGTNTWQTFTLGTGFALDVNDEIEYVIGITTSDQTDNAYGPYVASYKVPCKETPTVEHAVYNDEVETSLTATFYNADGDAGAETFSANQAQTVSLKLTAGSDEVFGNPFIEESGISGPQRAKYPNIVCFDLNSTAWDRPEWVKFDGVEMRSVGTPQRHTGSATDIAYCYEAPVIDDSAMEDDRYQIRLDSDDTNAPAIDDTAYIYAAGFYIDADTGAVAWGVEDEDGTAVGTDAADSVTLDFTA